MRDHHPFLSPAPCPTCDQLRQLVKAEAQEIERFRCIVEAQAQEIARLRQEQDRIRLSAMILEEDHP